MSRQLQAIEGAAIEQAHVGETVYGKYRQWALLPQVGQGHGRTGMPVVAVQHIRVPVQPGLARADGGSEPRQQHEPVGIVRPGLAIGTVVGIAGTICKRGMVQQPGLHPGTRQHGAQQAQGGACQFQFGNGARLVNAIQYVAIGR